MKKPSRRTQSSVKKPVLAGAVVFSVKNKTIRFLLPVRGEVRYGKGVVEIGPKGGIEKGETPLQAAKREIWEETGLSLHIDSTFKEETSFSVVRKEGKNAKKVLLGCLYFLAFMSPRDLRQISLSKEHSKCYLLPIEEAIQKIQRENRGKLDPSTINELKRILKTSKEYISQKYLT